MSWGDQEGSRKSVRLGFSLEAELLSPELRRGNIPEKGGTKQNPGLQGKLGSLQPGWRGRSLLRRKGRFARP